VWGSFASARYEFEYEINADRDAVASCVEGQAIAVITDPGVYGVTDDVATNTKIVQRQRVCHTVAGIVG
jgi:hypothetical protein